ncbi:MAG: aminopeptidase P family protein [Blautia sp.]|nr:aminopeptidase P family protein [Blautia sp.]
MDNRIKDRLAALRKRMEEERIDAWLVPTDDFHSSEYVGDHFKCRSYITGFTGSAGTALIRPDSAGLWTDGRYFIQAEKQLAGSGITLFRMDEPGVPSLHEYLQNELPEGACLGFDGRCVGAREAAKLREELSGKRICFRTDLDLVGDIWEDRPAMSQEPVEMLADIWTGEARIKKLERVRQKMAELGADSFLLASLDDIAWLLNLRGNDVECTPVFLGYLLLEKKKGLLFANEAAFPEEIREALAKDGILLQPYMAIYQRAGELTAGKKVLLSGDSVNSLLYEKISSGADILDEEKPTMLFKAVKNPVEIRNMRTAHIRDGVAVTKFIYWLKTHVAEEEITEISAAEKLLSLREEQEHFRGNSFSPIISYGAHGAIVHYSATEETDCRILPKGLVLADTGGHYLEGTTDITRTIAVGPVTEEEKLYFTEVLRGHLNLADACFRYGCTGLNLDYLAREPLWKMGKDYRHGTGHGVGYYLNVHEGPNGFRWKQVPERKDCVRFEEGMITSDEPGYYEEGQFGIRHESLLLCRKKEETEAGTFMKFEILTMVPIDLEGVDPDRMSLHEKGILNRYHETVYQTISPYLTEEESIWLREATRPL